MYTPSSKKFLAAAVLCSLFAASPVWAAADPQTTVTNVNNTSRLTDPYSAITVSTSEPAIGVVNNTGFTVYVADGAKVNSVVYNAGSGATLTISGNMDQTVEIDGSLSTAFNLQNGSITQVDSPTVTVTSTNYGYAKGASVEDSTLKAAGGVWTVKADSNSGGATAYGVYNSTSYSSGSTVTFTDAPTVTVEATNTEGLDNYVYAAGLYNEGNLNAITLQQGAIITATIKDATGTNEGDFSTATAIYNLLGTITANGKLDLTATATGGQTQTGKPSVEAYGIYNEGTANVIKDLTINASATGGIAQATTTVTTNAYGINNTTGGTVTVAGVTNITAAGRANTNNVDGTNDVMVNGIANRTSTMTLQDKATITATVGSSAEATAIAVANIGSTLNTNDLILKATADGVELKAASAAKYNSIKATGLDNEESTLDTGNISLDISASGGSLAADATAKKISVTATGLYNNDSTAKPSVSVGTVSGTVTATGASAASKGKDSSVNAYGINNDTGSLTAAGTDFTVTATGSYGEELSSTEAVGILSGTNGKDVTVTGTSKLNVAITVAGTAGLTESGAYGVRLRSGADTSTVTLGDVTGSVQALTATGAVIGGYGILGAIGLKVDGTAGKTSTMTAQNVDLAVTATDTATASANGLIMVGTAGLSASDGTLRISGDAKVKTGITASNAANEFFTACAVSSLNNGVIDVGVTADGTTSLGKTVQLEGDVQAYDDGKVNLTLDGPDSYLQGNVQTENPLNYGGTSTSGTVNLTVTKGATWRPVYDNRYGTANKYQSSIDVHPQSYTFADNSIDTLALSNGGIVDLTWDNATRDPATAGRTLTITELSGEGGIFKINSNLTQNKADEITLGENSTSTGVGIDVAYDPAMAADDLTTASSITGKALVLTDKSAKLTSVTGVADSYNLYDYTPTITANGDGTYSLTKLTITNVKPQPEPEPTPTPTPTPTPDNPKQDVTSQSKPMREARHNRMAMHNLWVNGELNNLQKRLGDLRAVKPADSGIWARYEYNKLEKGSDASLKYNMFQLGYDKDYQGETGTFYRGAAFSYAKGTGSYEVSNGDLKEGTLSLYQTWAGKDGRYYDVILKGGKIMSSYDLNDTANPSSADYHSWAYSLSGEIGKRFNKANGFYVEPQFEFTLGRINGADYTTSTGMDVNVSSQNTALARLGISAGRETAKGSYFAKASYYHDFGGGLNLTASDNSTNPYSYGEDSAKNWLVFTLGGTVKAGKNCNIYGELSKFAGQLTNDVQVNVGARWSF